MNEKIKIIIADDNKAICDFIKKYLEQYEDIEILGVANTDEEEEKMIEDLKPEVVITDLMRNHKYTGLDIIKKYANKNNSPEFLVVSSDRKEDVIRDGLDVAGYVQKGFNFDYDLILKEVRRIKAEINKKKTK
jgi:two-component system response regulator (stage 0 sporulation protein A)